MDGRLECATVFGRIARLSAMTNLFKQTETNSPTAPDY